MNHERLQRMKDRIELAMGRRKVEKLLTNCKVINVFNGKIESTSIAISAGKIIGLGDYEAEEVIDLNGAFVAPGFIDAHMHMESTLVTPEQMSRIIVPRGTTTVIADPHEIANVCGLEGIRFMIDSTEKTKLNGFFMLPSCVPATPFENAGAILDANALGELVTHKKVLGLGELMNYPGVVNGDDDVLQKIDLCYHRIIDGHGPAITGKTLNAYVINGIKTEHECTTIDEMQERLGLGMYIAIREGSAARNLETLIKGVNDTTKHMCMFCTDDKHPEDILKEGHIDHNIRRAIELGTDPVVAIQMATINPARCYELRDIGAIAPGYDADLVVIDDLKAFNIMSVYKNGDCVARNLTPLFEPHPVDPTGVMNTVKIKPISPDQFELKLKSDVVNVIRMNPGSIVTEHVVRRIYQDENGYFISNPRLDIAKLAVVERHGKTDNIGIGLVENFGLTGGAIATSIAHDSHNIIVIGGNDLDMSMAVNALIEVGGGISVVHCGKVLDVLPLPIAGLMSQEPMEVVSEKLHHLRTLAYDTLNITRKVEPFMTLSFLALPVIPELKLTDRGYFDVGRFNWISVEAY